MRGLGSDVYLHGNHGKNVGNIFAYTGFAGYAKTGFVEIELWKQF